MTPTPPAMRASVYVRLSKEDVSGKQLGIESTGVQLKDAREAVEREGWVLDERHIYKDDGLSGTKVNRADWQAMLAAAKRREFDVIVVRDLDRFSRLEPIRALGIIRDLAEVGVKLWSYRERRWIRVDGDHVVFTAMEARRASAYSENASVWISGGLRRRAREGRATRRAPFGNRTTITTEQNALDARAAGDETIRAGKWWTKYEPEVAVYKHVAAIFLETESLGATARRLNEDGTRPPKGPGWGHGSVKMLLTQPHARGYDQHKGERIDHPELRIFTPEEVQLIDAALARASKNRPWSVAERTSKKINLAVPFVGCGVCGRGIVATGSGSKRMYVCDSQRVGRCRGVGYRSAARVDEAIVRAIDATLTDEAISAVCALVRQEIEARPRASEDDRDRITREISTTEKRIANLTEAVAEAPAGVRAPLYAKLAAEQDRLAALRAGLARLDGAPPELDARRAVANVQRRARELRTMLAAGGKDATAAIRAVLGQKRLKAHLVTVEGKRGWKLSGRISGFYVFDDAHHGSDSLLKKNIKGAVPATAQNSAPPATAPATSSTATTPAAPAPKAGS